MFSVCVNVWVYVNMCSCVSVCVCSVCVWICPHCVYVHVYCVYVLSIWMSTLSVLVYMCIIVYMDIFVYVYLFNVCMNVPISYLLVYVYACISNVMCSVYIWIGLCLCIYMCVYNVYVNASMYILGCVCTCVCTSLYHWVYECVSFCVCLCELVCMCALDRCPWVYHAPALGPINVSQLCPGLWAPEFCCFSLFPYFAAVDTGVQSTLPASFQTQPYTRRLGLLWSGCHWTEFFCGGRSQPSSQGSPWSLI